MLQGVTDSFDLLESACGYRLTTLTLYFPLVVSRRPRLCLMVSTLPWVREAMFSLKMAWMMFILSGSSFTPNDTPSIDVLPWSSQTCKHEQSSSLTLFNILKTVKVMLPEQYLHQPRNVFTAHTAFWDTSIQ